MASNILPLTGKQLNTPILREFRIKLSTNGQSYSYFALALNSCDAISHAVRSLGTQTACAIMATPVEACHV